APGDPAGPAPPGAGPAARHAGGAAHALAVVRHAAPGPQPGARLPGDVGELRSRPGTPADRDPRRGTGARRLTRAGPLQLPRGADGQELVDLVGLEAQGHGPGHAGQDDDVVQLADHAFQPDPVGGVTAAQVDDVDAAARLGPAAGEFLVQG